MEFAFSFVVFLNLLISASTSPQIFTESASCELNLNKEKVIFPDKIYSINTKEFNLYFSFCKRRQKVCKNKSSSCLIYKTSPEIITFQDAFQTDAATLTSQTDETCSSDASKFYTLSISLVCYDSIKPKPRLIQDEDNPCHFEIILMRPDCEPKCTHLIQDIHLSDFRNFKRPFRIETNGRKFSLNLCGANPNCTPDATTCEITNNQVAPLADLSSQRFQFDVTKNQLTARGKYVSGTGYSHQVSGTTESYTNQIINKLSVVTDIQVLMKCNWNSDLANAKYKVVPRQGKHYKFELESSFACIKLPQSCQVTSFNNFQYDLRKLNNENGWEVSGAPPSQGRILLNVCGDLKNLKGICKDQFSQVCQLNKNSYTNYGSILQSLKVSMDEKLTMSYVSGSQCFENATLSYSTQIKFECSPFEKGPKFIESRQCVLFILWQTPKACPLDIYTSDNCIIHDRISHRNLQNLYTDVDRVYQLTANQKLIYNLCGPIHSTCNNATNVSFCLQTAKQETVVGWNSKQLISENGDLRMILKGSSNVLCDPEIQINFVCNYANQSPIIRVLADRCRYNMTIFTHLACLSQGKFANCSISSTNQIYDLSQLSRKTDNYVIEKDDVEFIFNLCGPIVSNSQASCPGDTMVCWKNKTELDVAKKFKSLGGIGQPKLYNNSLIIEAQFGKFCPEFVHYQTIFHFKCSQIQFSPTFMFEEHCLYHFEWKTPQACPKSKDCLITGNHHKFNLSSLQKKTILFNIDNGINKYEFDLCQDLYTQQYHGQATSHLLSRELSTNGNNRLVILKLSEICKNSTVSQVNLQFECSESDKEHFETVSFKNCVLNMTVYTNLVCSTTQKESEEDGESMKVETNCTILSPQTGYEFRLSQIKRQQFEFNQSEFLLNLDGNSDNCNSYFCKNSIPFIDRICPKLTFDYQHKQIILEFLNEENEEYKFLLYLECNKTKSNWKVIKEENYQVYSSLHLPEACFLLQTEIIEQAQTTHNSGTVIAITVTIILLIVISSLMIFIYLKRRRYSIYWRRLFASEDKNSVPIYCRNATE